MQQFDVLIIGAGAAGLMCAIQAGKRGKTVCLIDHAKAVGEKIRISGGGRCNFTNINTSQKNFLSQNPKFCISALKTYTQHDFISLVKKHKIPYHEKTLGQLFCDESSKQIISMLLLECSAAKVSIHLETKVTDIRKNESGFSIDTEDKKYSCKSLVIATGGKSIPKMGATAFGYDIAEKFGLDIIEPRAALVPLTFSQDILSRLNELSGISLEAEVSFKKTKFREALLFTHRGMSGPSILQISSYWEEGQEIEINLVPDENIADLLKKGREEHPKQEIQTKLSHLFAKRLADYIAEQTKSKGRLADMSNKHFENVGRAVNNWKIKPLGTEGYRTAEVTLGGINTKNLSSKTFESKDIKGLYFIGEVLDVTGHLGGYNFQWAWSSGYAAGQQV